METSELLKYLSIIIDLEKSKYTQEQTIKLLNGNISSYKKEYDTNIALNKNVDAQATTNAYTAKNVTADTSGKGLMYFMVYYVGCLGAGLGIAVWNLTKTIPLSIIVGLIGAVIGGSIPIAVWKNILKKRKERAVIQINRGNRADIELKESRNLRNKELAVIIPKLDAENKAMQETYQLTCLSLKQCYDVDIIPVKYRNFVPVCMFYDYISNGRTYTLKRNPTAFDEGAINMYEDELFKKEISDKLNIMINHLEAIRSNQKMVYDAIQEGNRQTHTLLNNINSNVTKVNDKLSTIQYQNEQRNRCTEYLAYVASKYHYGY